MENNFRARMQLEKEIKEAYLFLRENNNTVPSKTLDFMKECSITALEVNCDLRELLRCLQIITNVVEDDIRINHDERYLKIIKRCNEALQTKTVVE